MKRFLLSRGPAVLALSGLILALSGGALLWASPSPPSVPRAAPAPSAGKKVYDKWCADCHAAGGPGSQALQRKYQGQVPAALLQRTDMTPEYVGLVVRQGMSFMPSFRKTEISDAELALMGAYLAANSEAAKKAGGE